MALFGRRKNDDRTATDEAGAEVDAAGAGGDARDAQGTGTLDEAASELSDGGEEMSDARRRRGRLRPREDVDLSAGPYDAASAPEGERLDFGALALSPSESVELRLDVDENTQVITGMTAVLGEGGAGAVQLQVFAAPKTSGIWYGIRREIAESILAGGGTADEVEGPLGTELHVRMPSQGPDGRTTFSPARFVGIDGPRWFLRAVLSGAAAVEEEAIERAMQFVRSVVVRRGGEARAPRELLELTLPPELLAQAQAGEPEQGGGSGPLERGPELTETR